MLLREIIGAHPKRGLHSRQNRRQPVGSRSIRESVNVFAKKDSQTRYMYTYRFYEATPCAGLQRQSLGQ